LKHGDLAGSWGIHITKPDGVSPISLDERPNYWLDTRSETGDKPANNLAGQAVPGENAHVPSLAYVPYLVTGDRYYADEMRFWANFAALETWPGSSYARRGAQGLLWQLQIRGMAWGLRNIVDCAAYLPDADPYKRYFVRMAESNLKNFDNYANTFVSPLNTVFDGKNTDAGTIVAPVSWQYGHLAWSIDHALDQGFSSGGRMRDRLVRVMLAPLTSPGFNPAYAEWGWFSIARATPLSPTPTTTASGEWMRRLASSRPRRVPVR
jgi:hypothetical protein